MLSGLRVFDRVACHQGVREAADQLSVTPGAVSQQLRKLEDDLGTLLFERRPEGLRLTVAGEQLYQQVRPAMSSLEQAVDALLQADSLVRVAAPPSLAFHWLTPRLSDFQRHYPQISIELSALDIGLVKAGQFDLMLDYGPVTEARDRLKPVALMGERLVPVCSPDYGQSFDWQNADCWRQAALLHDSAAWQGAEREAEWLAWWQAICPDMPMPERQFYFNRVDMAVEAAAAGLGIALARRSILADVLASGRLVAVGPEWDTPWGYQLYGLTEGVQAPAVRLLSEWLTQQCSG